ncbi:cbb3-type cytochrome c oxidase N-terminal domain-containing protein [Zobellia uliginosa]|uniref:cbb3-type cytochrome c oxidase N-terminal domain-containing protein n=1 Tax=Zobellia uliginosa TaxID=143224 RepID=UPI001C06AAF3|nr:cbb3-type cytochrome c oxidase N-terminal domain-containing protein [Zobellia uliginosa]MBU2947750.1 c-type cytochrome [Zobellia uliginosa]
MKNTSTWWIKIPLIFFIIFGITEFVVDSGEMPAFIKYPMVQVFLVFVLFLLIVIAVITRAIENVMFQTLSKEAQERYIAAKSKSFHWKWGEETYQNLLGSKPIEKEGEIILDHNYDGIRELDNNLPPWWVYLFYASIVFAVVYLARFHVFNEYDQIQEYDQEVAAAQLEIEEYKKTAKGLVDANTVELLTDAGDLKAGQTIFESNCVACHMVDGGGGIGPNLTDQNWILGGGIKNVFHTISEGGRDGKGMIAWKQNLKPAEIAQVASYVLSFQGTTPANPKAAEGDLWVDPNAPESATPAEEASTEQEVDSTSVTMN